MALTNTGRSVITTHGAFASRGFDADFKIFYDNVLGQLWCTFSPVMDWLQKESRVNTVKPQGRYINFAVETNLGSGVGARGEGDTLPLSANMTVTQGSVDYQRGFKGRFSITEEAKLWGKQGAGAFADVLDQEMRNCEHGIRNLAAAAVWGDGGGVLARSTTGTTSATVTIDRSELSTACLPGTRWLFEGQRIYGGTLSTNNTVTLSTSWDATDANITYQTIKSIDSDTQITLNHSNTWAASTYWFDFGSITAGTASTYRGPSGLNNIIDDGTFSQNSAPPLDPAFGCCGLVTGTYPSWKAVISSNSGTARALTTDLIYQMYFKQARKVGDLKHKPVCWTNTDVFREFIALLEPQVQYQARKLEAGFEDEMEIMINGVGVPIRLDMKAPSYWYFVNPKYLDFYNSRPLGLVSDDNGSSQIPNSNATNWEYRYWWAWQLGTKARNRHGVIQDITSTITSV